MNEFDWWSLYQEGLIEFEFNDAEVEIEPFEGVDDLDITIAYKTYRLSANELNKIIVRGDNGTLGESTHYTC